MEKNKKNKIKIKIMETKFPILEANSSPTPKGKKKMFSHNPGINIRYNIYSKWNLVKIFCCSFLKWHILLFRSLNFRK